MPWHHCPPVGSSLPSFYLFYFLFFANSVTREQFGLRVSPPTNTYAARRLASKRNRQNKKKKKNAKGGGGDDNDNSVPAGVGGGDFVGFNYASGSNSVTGVGRFKFLNLHQSCHVRTHQWQVYHGEWVPASSVPPSALEYGHHTLAPFNGYVPHGEGLIQMLKGWGAGREEKQLTITVHCARDLTTSSMAFCDPFVTMKCNLREATTSVVSGTTEPLWNETFYLDATDPSAILEVRVGK